jgi:4-nitrophenyl phosphatase
MKNRPFKAILADLDGTINRGNTLIPGVKEVYDSLSARGLQWMFISNNATKLDSELAVKVSGLGLDVRPDQVVSSATALTQEISSAHRGAEFFVVGAPNLIRGLLDAGALVVENPRDAAIVVVALDTGVTYEKIKNAHIAIQNRAKFWATNLDATFPVEDGFHPGAGSLVAAVAAAAGRPPDRVFGKPSPDMALIALKRLNLAPEYCIVVGDRMETDILFAKNAGLASALVLTGAAKREDVDDSPFKPDYVLDHIEGLAQVIG